MTNKLPLRRCIGCMQSKEKSELIRVVRTAAGDISIDFGGKAQGRGAYICKSSACLAAAEKRKQLERAFRTKISEEIYSGLKDAFSDDK